MIQVNKGDLEGREDAARKRGTPGADNGAESDYAELTPELRAELLDPESWGVILEMYARTMKLPVALVDADGLLVGECHNPQAIWTLARNSRAASVGACPFCLETIPKCSAAADALRTKSLVLVHDQAGFAHLALPLTLGEWSLGTLFAGQILDQYPESLSLQRLARSFGLAPQAVWDLARRQAPLGRAKLTVYGELLGSFTQTFLRDRYGVILERRSKEETKALNQKLLRGMAEKEVLLREVHHRVKNNLQVISSLLSMQVDRLSEVGAVAALEDSRGRVRSMALIHERLYCNDRWDEIDFEDYAKTIVPELFAAFGAEAKGVVSRFKMSRVLLDVDQAIPCGLILNELVTNVHKHAYPDGKGGEVIIELSEATPGIVRLCVTDDGVGLPEGFDVENPRTMGMEIVSILAKQLGGVLTIRSRPKTSFGIEFPRETRERALAVSA